MKLKKARENYEYFSGEASKISRQLAFAGIAFVWIFKIEVGDQYQIPDGLQRPIFGLLLFLFFDLAQYIYASAAWGIFSRHHEVALRKRYGQTKDRNEIDITTSPVINWPTNLFYWSKFVVLGVAYLLLAAYAWKLI